MAIDLYDAVNGDGLLQIQGKGFYALDTLNTARLTTVPTEVEAFLAQEELLAGAPLAYKQAIEGVASAAKSWVSSGSILTGSIRTACERLLIEAVAADAPQPSRSLTRALEYLIDQMETAGDYVDANAVGLSLATGASNTGDVAICYSTLRGDGKAQQNLYAETIDIEVTADGSSTPSLQFQGDAADGNRLSEAWPKGSGCNLTVAAVDAADSLLSNGDFEDTTLADVPDDWLITVGTPGTSITVTDPEVQTVVIGGTPTGGHYFLYYTDAAGIKRATEALAHNASGSTVQTALRAIPGLEAVTVTTSGTSPDYTHTVTLHGVAGNPAQLTSKSNLTGGTPTITHGTTTAGNANSYRGRTLKIQGDDTELTTLYHPLSGLLPETPYFVHFRVKRTQSGASALADELTVDIVDAIDGTTTADDAGNDNELVIDAKAISTTAFESKFFSFRLKRTTTQPVYLRIKTSSALAADAALYIDEMAIAVGRRLYPGGPYVAAFSGANAAVLGDSWVLTATNDRAGSIQTWYNRAFDMAGKDLLLPTAGAGTAIPDTVIGPATTTTTAAPTTTTGA